MSAIGHFDKAGIEPLFPFGYGLSYTTFAYGNLRLSSPGLQPGQDAGVSLDVTNTGTRDGEEIVQLYVHDLHPKIYRPVRELKGLSRSCSSPGETKAVRLTVRARDLAYFDVLGHQWKADAGDYGIEVGASSATSGRTLRCG